MSGLTFQKISTLRSPHPDRGSYAFCRQIDPHLRIDVCPWNPLSEQELLERGVLMLSHMALNGWNALQMMLPGNTHLFEDMQRNCLYQDVLSQGPAHSLAPVAIVAKDLAAYAQALGEKDLDFLRYTYWHDSAADYWSQTQFGYSEEMSFDNLDRVTTVLLGTGHTQLCLPSDGESVYAWERMDLSNGDSLLLIGLEWFNN